MKYHNNVVVYKNQNRGEGNKKVFFLNGRPQQTHHVDSTLDLGGIGWRNNVVKIT